MLRDDIEVTIIILLLNHHVIVHVHFDDIEVTIIIPLLIHDVIVHVHFARNNIND